MTKWTHIRQFDGFSRGPLTDTVRPYPDQIRHALTTMNGTSKWAYSLWRAPEGADLLEDIPFSDEYLQCAGSVEAMTIEVRIVDDEGEAFRAGLPPLEPGSYELSALLDFAPDASMLAPTTELDLVAGPPTTVIVH